MAHMAHQLGQFLSFWALIILFIHVNIPSTRARPTFAVSAAARPSRPPNPPELVRDVCKNTTDYGSCLEILLKDPRTRSLSTKPRLEQRVTVAKVAFDEALKHIDNVLSFIDELMKKSTGSDGKLIKCQLMYEFMGTDMGSAAAVVGQQDPTTLYDFPSGDLWGLNQCEEQYQPAQSSPLYRVNGHTKLLLDMAVAITLIPV